METVIQSMRVYLFGRIMSGALVFRFRSSYHLAAPRLRTSESKEH
jgi:hypothetical protein